ncbi:hypothetical protein ABZX85_12090 [Streptomyces sp. NPDC004539]|uniref:hypothetical protein n=1 Tax=Streptomyces sp. NPDC004539 TaxID=3154280 RepID=UPI00339E9463
MRLDPPTRAALVGALGLTTALSLVSPASAATNLRGVEPFNTDKLLMSMCTGSTDKQYFFINVNTGELTRNPTNGIPADSLPHPIERFEGWCTYPKASSWTWTGQETQVGNSLRNCGNSSQLSQSIQMNGTTTSTTTNSVSGSVGVQWTIIDKVLSVNAGADYTRSWSYAKASGWATTTTLTAAPRTTAWMSLAPVMRTVRSNPVFWVDRYSWGRNGGGQINVGTWRDRGYRDIKSHGAYYDAIGNVLDGNGKPAGTYVARDRPVNSSDKC